MADRMVTLNLGGMEVQVPQWASEETMNRVVSYMSAENKTSKDLNKMMSKVGGNVNDLQKEISGLLTATQKDNVQDQQQEKKSERFSTLLVKNSEGLMKTATFFGNTEKPLSAIVSAGGSLVKGAKDSSGGLKLFDGLMKSGSLWSNALGTAGNIAVDAMLAYAGWNAAKIEQFAGAQSKIIDAGVVYNGGAAAFDELRKNTLSTGVSYTSLIDNVHNFGEGMLGLGGTMSEGVLQFTRFYQALDETAGNFGDLGLSSKDMQSQYGEFIHYARRTGMINSDLNNSAEDVNRSFIDLQIEAGTVASLTSLTRNEAMRRQLGAFDEFGEAAAMSLEDLGLSNKADTLKAITKNVGLLAPDDEHMQVLLDAFQQEAFEKSKTGDFTSFDLSGRMQEMMKGSEAALANVYPNFVEGIEAMMQTGEASNDDVRDFIFNALNTADTTRFSTFNAAADTISGQTQRLAANAIVLKRKFGNLGNPEEFAKEKANMKKNLKEAGKVTMEMNNMTRRFLEVQETLTMDMETVANIFNGVYDLFGKTSNKMTSLAALSESEQETNNFGGKIGVDMQDATIAVTGGVAYRPQYESAADEEGDTAKVKEAKKANRSVGYITEEDIEGLTQIENVENSLMQLNSLAPEMRRRMLNAMKEFDEKYKDTDTKMTVTTGSTLKQTGDKDTWANNSMGASILILQGDQIVTNDDTGMYSKELASILNNNNLINDTGAGTGQIVPQEAKSQTINNFKSGDTGGHLTIQPAETRKHGGPVDAGNPYIVGDQLGLNTAELFVPNTDGTILSNKETKSMNQETIHGKSPDRTISSNIEIMQALMPEIAKSMEMMPGNSPVRSKILEMIQNNLTNPDISRKINNSQELTEIINSKRHTIEALVQLRTIVKRLNKKYNLDIDIDMMNSR